MAHTALAKLYVQSADEITNSRALEINSVDGAGKARASLEKAQSQRLAERLREAPVPVLARVRNDELLLDVRTLLDEDEIELEAAIKHALSVGSE